MKKFISKGVFILLLLSSLCISCNDDTPNYDKKQINNPELTVALQKQGFELEGNALVMNDKVENITTLDLSFNGLTHTNGLELFPNLQQVNLAGNKLGPSFDFAKLPSTITTVNLANNNIYDYQGLVDVDFDAAKVTVLRPLDRLILPYSARFNMDALPFYMKEGGATDMQMQDKEGKAAIYNTLREVPDTVLRKYLKTYFSSIMTADDKIDIGKRINSTQEGMPLNIDMTFYYEPVSGPVDLTAANDIQGIEYIINNPFYKGSMIMIQPPTDKTFNLEYFKPRESLITLVLTNINTPIVDWTSAKHLRYLFMSKNTEIKEVNFNQSEYFMQKEGGYIQGTMAVDGITVYDCPKLETINMPKVSPIPIYTLELYVLPSLKEIDISSVLAAGSIYMSQLPNLKELNFSSMKHTVETDGGELDKMPMSFSISEDILKIRGVKDFIIRFGSENKFRNWGALNSMFFEYGFPFEGMAYDYRILYKTNKEEKTNIENSFTNTHENIFDLIRSNLKQELRKRNQ